MNKILIFTDGASRGNPGPGGWGAIIAISKEDQIIELGGSEKNTTNNRMELVAAIEALKYLDYTLNAKGYTLSLYTDSSYLINGITKWISGWRINNWQTKNKKEVLNRQLWENLASLAENKNIEWKYVGGHIGVPANERVDEIATEFADSVAISPESTQGTGPKLYSGPLSKYGIDVLDFRQDKKMTATRTRRGQVDYSYVSMVDGKIKTHKTWSDCEKRVKGKSGARFKKAISAEEEQLIKEEWRKI